jgi:hypothetical protein
MDAPVILAGNACHRTVILREMTLEKFKILLGKFAKEFLMETSVTLMLTVTLKSSAFLTNNGLLSLHVSNLGHLMKDALTILSALLLITAGSLLKKMLRNLITHVSLTASAYLNFLRIMKRSSDGNTLLGSLTYRT